jgi:hypothetical protein
MLTTKRQFLGLCPSVSRWALLLNPVAGYGIGTVVGVTLGTAANRTRLGTPFVKEAARNLLSVPCLDAGSLNLRTVLWFSKSTMK